LFGADQQLRRRNARDLVALKLSLQQIPKLKAELGKLLERLAFGANRAKDQGDVELLAQRLQNEIQEMPALAERLAKALADDLGPILIFAPRRQATESMAAELARFLPTPNPLQLSVEQKQVVGENLARMLKSRITYHHSGLSYAARAGGAIGIVDQRRTKGFVRPDRARDRV